MPSTAVARRTRTAGLGLFAVLLCCALLAAAALVVVELRAGRPSAGEPRCVVTAAEDDGGTRRHVLSAEQGANAALVTAEAVARGLERESAVIALATAMQESRLVNIDYGDRDSLGLFQQRPSTGWGTPEQILNASHAARLFYGGPSNPNKGKTRGLLDIPGWQSMSLTQAAQAVQISAYPNAYAKWETSAVSWLAQLG